jgi:hypothetical protein
MSGRSAAAQFGQHRPQMFDLDLLGEELSRLGRMLSATLGALGQDQCSERNDVAGKILRISEHMR